MKHVLCDKRGEGYIDTGVKIIIAVVIGALILGGIYLLFAGDNGVINRLNGEVKNMMDYTQELRYERYYNENTGLYSLRYSYDGEHWNDAEIPTISDTATVYNTMTNSSETDPIEVALMKDGNRYYVITSEDQGITWIQRYAFTAQSITHFYYGNDAPLPNTAGSFSGEKFVIRYWVAGSTYNTMISSGLIWQAGWSDIILS